MSNTKLVHRFTCLTDGIDRPFFHPHPEGEMVRYADYARAEAEISLLQERYAHEENQRMCLGYLGGCSGDLYEEPHSPKCPAYRKDRELNPHLYAALKGEPTS